MTIEQNALIGNLVHSLQTGDVLARIDSLIIDPNELKIVALALRGRKTIIVWRDLREVSSRGIVVDDDSALVDRDSIVRLKAIRQYRFKLIGLRVRDRHRRRLGVIVNYSIDVATGEIDHIITHTGLFGCGDELYIGRDQIVEISDRYVIVDAPTVQVARSAAFGINHRAFDPATDNPFRCRVN